MQLPEDVARATRLDALRRFGILGTDPERDFDDLAQLASRVCEVPIALVSFVAKDHQFFKAAVGLDLPGTPIAYSICVHALSSEDILEISDTEQDPRTRDNPLVFGDAGVRFYAGAPLITEDGEKIGTLCVLDYEPRVLSDVQRETLNVLSRQVMKQLNLRRAVAEAEVLRRQVDHRVRNSLQSVTALTRLQARNARPDVRSALQAVVQRIQTVSALHDQLFHVGDQDEVDLATYLTSVLSLIDAVRPGRIALETSLAPIRLEARRAAAVATVVNEFVQNSFAHAFPEGRGGTIAVSGRFDGDGAYRLTLRDDGAGLPEGDGTSGGLGFTVIDACAAQVGGTFEHTPSAQGLRADLVFRP